MDKLYKKLVAQGLGEYLLNYVLEEPSSLNELATNQAVMILSELQEIFSDKELIQDDFLLVDQIVSTLNKYGIDTGLCHDF